MPIRILLLTAFLILCLFAQTPTATVVGRVIDSTGAVDPEAKLQIRHVNTNAIRTAESGGDGACAG
jgi:hypothetical protein